MISQRAECDTTTEPCRLSDINSDVNTPSQKDEMWKTDVLTAANCPPGDLDELVPSDDHERAKGEREKSSNCSRDVQTVENSQGELVEED